MMMARLNAGQERMLRAKPFARDSFFNPVKDRDGNWVISMEEVQQCTNPQFSWVKTLPLIPWNPPPVDLKLLGLLP